MFEITPSPEIRKAGDGDEYLKASNKIQKGESEAGATGLPEVVFSHIEAKDIPVMDVKALGVGGKADPYIKFYTEPADILVTKKQGQHQVKSSTKMRTQSPTWDEEMVIKLSVESQEDCFIRL